ncbi:hypothetical protein [Mycobacteroides sp. PCS013]|uniref:hypothetical protein n=1 Tax=Mycobacteroides sp. PCS013 TaxID=3074106 RepID=UPI003C2EDE4C
MSDKSAGRQVLAGIALLLATAGVFLALTLGWRAHVLAEGVSPTTTSAKLPRDLAVYLPNPSEYPAGFTTPPANGIAIAKLAIPVSSPDQPTVAPCDSARGMPAQLPTGDTPAQLYLTHFTRAGGSILSIVIAEPGAWRDLSAVRTWTAQCPQHGTADITCTDTAHLPIPAVSADDVAVVESRCRSSFDYRYLTYYAVVRGCLVYITAHGDDPRPAENVLDVIVNKVRSDGAAR